MKTFKQFIVEASSGCSVSPNDLYAKILQYIKDKPTYNMGKPPTNGEVYGIDGTAESWARFYVQLAGYESGYNACKPFKDAIKGVPEPGGSGGLFQLGRDQIEIWAKKYPSLASQYGLSPYKNYSEQDLLNADLNTLGMLFIGDALLREDYSVGPKVGLGRTIGSLSWNKIAKGTPFTPSKDSDTLIAKNTEDKPPIGPELTDYRTPMDAMKGLMQGLQAMGKTMGIGS